MVHLPGLIMAAVLPKISQTGTGPMALLMIDEPLA
jgi:hypothetical protein